MTNPPESQNIEFKSSWHDDYLKWICGFANASGDVIDIGKNDNGAVIGLADYARLIEELPNKIRNAMGIICDVQLHNENSKKFISIKVNPYSVPVSLRGRFYYRSGSAKVELTGIELNEFLLKKSGKTWDDMIEDHAAIDDIDEQSIAKFIADSESHGRLPATKGLGVFQILEKLKLTASNKLKRAAIIMFGKDPAKFYPNIQVKIGRFGIDSTDLRFQEIVEGNLVKILDEVQVQLKHNSSPRNPILAHACFLGGYIDAWGRGTLKIINSCKEAGLKEPEIIEKDGGIAMTLFAANYPVNVSNLGKTSGKIIDAMRINPYITIPELAELIGVTTRSIERNIESLKRAKQVQRIGSAKDGYWEVALITAPSNLQNLTN